MLNNSSLLKKALLADSILSFLVGVDLLLFSKSVASFLGLSAPWIVLVIGVICIAYSIELYLAARAEPIHTGIAKFATYGNLVWVLGSALLIFANLVPFTAAGKWTIAIAADAVLVLAIFQYIGLRKLAS